MSAEWRGRWLAVAVALGLSADGLLRAHPWGLNLFLWTASVMVAGALLRRRGVAFHPGPSPWLLGAALVLAGGAAWRADELLGAVDVLGAVVFIAVAARRARVASLAPEARGVGLGAACVDALGNFGLAVRSAKAWSLTHRSGGSAGTRWRQVASGAALSVPALLVFGGLFVSADPVFDRVVRSAFRVRWGTAVDHGAWILWWAWVAGAYTIGIVRGPAVARDTPRRFPLGGVEVFVLLGSVAALFALFVVTQAGILFGGEEFVRRTSGLTFAAYARRGFYQLMAVAALSLPLVVTAGRILRPESPRTRAGYRLLALIQIGLLVPVLGSAMWRMALYVSAYGLTVDRLYATTGILWLAGMTALTGWGLGRGRTRMGYLTTGGLAGAFLSILLLHAVNPASVVVRWNLERAAKGERAFDAAYAAGLGADAIPTLWAVGAELSPVDRCLVVQQLRRSRPYWDGSWRTYNVARVKAEAAAERLEKEASWYASCPTTTESNSRERTRTGGGG